MKQEKGNIEHVEAEFVKDIPYINDAPYANATYTNSQNSKALVPIFMSALGLLKTVVLPFWGGAKFVKNDLYRSVKHDVKIAAFIAFASVVIVVMSILIWITIGAGIVIYLISGTGAILSAWLYILLFEIGTVVVLSIGIAISKHLAKTPEAVERAKELLGDKS